MLWLHLLNLVFSINEIAFQNITYKFWWIICNFFGQSLLSTSTWNFLKHFILFNVLSWLMFVSSCVYCSKLVSFSITFAVNKLLFESLEISCISGTIILSTSSRTRYVLDMPLKLSCNILSISILSKNVKKVFTKVGSHLEI